MAASSLLRWGIMLSAAALVLAVALRLQDQQPFQSRFLSTASAPTKHCYKSIRTHDQEQPTAQCFSVQDGFFQEVTGETVQEPQSEGYAIPGLWDGHGHLLQYGEFLHSVDLFGSESLDDARSRIKAYLDKNPGAGTKDQWLRGVGWDQAYYGRMPTADDLSEDPVLKDAYIMLDRVDVHCSWVSQPILDLLPAEIPDVPGGDIIRDPGMGVFCDNAMSLITDLWPEPSPETRALQIKTAMAKLNEVGLVGMHDAGAAPDTLRLFQSLADDDDWTVRVYSMLECAKRNEYCPDDAVKIERDDHRLAVRSVKLFADGALGSWGSAMIDPYTDHPWTSGSLLINASALTTVATSWASQGYQVNIHAIGDLANRNAIDALAAALEQECRSSNKDVNDLSACQSVHRYRIEHAQIIHPDDQSRLLALGIIPSIQPTHATSDFRYAEDRLGKERLTSEAYRMKSLLPARPVLGSDFPVEPPNPFEGIYAAVTRKSPHTGLGPGDGDAGFLPDQVLTLDQALDGFTLNVAHGAFLDGRAGVIKAGALADWVVLDKPIHEYATEDLRSLRVKETWVGGVRVYARP